MANKEKIVRQNLIFEPTTYRDWTVIYCQIAYQIFTQEFENQFMWRYTDVCLLWDGRKEILYRSNKEHTSGMFQFIVKELKKNPDFIKDTSELLIQESQDYKKKFSKLLSFSFKEKSNRELNLLFFEFVRESIAIGPKYVMMIYFPQQIEFYSKYELKYRGEKDIAVQARTVAEKIYGPLSDGLSEKFGKEALRRIKLPEDYYYFISIEETSAIFKDKVSGNFKLKLTRELKKRKKYFFVAGGNIWHIPLKQYLNAKGWNLIEHSVDKEVKTIKGTPAFKQRKAVIGKVVIVENKRELFKVQENDILVAPMTIPEYVPAISKVSAIITDEGGVTCHAAIVAREMNKPCIIGTKIATKVLKDGDLVEVDADNGIVKVIKRAEQQG